VLPFRKVTVPLGIVPDPVTVAEKVTGWPAVPGFGDAVSVVALAGSCVELIVK
jgi:hypothetical protein